MDLRSAATTRLAALTLSRRGYPRGLTFDDVLVRAGVVVDLAVRGALIDGADAVEVDPQRAAEPELRHAAALLRNGGGSLTSWLDGGALDFDRWADVLVGAEVWERGRWSPLRLERRHRDLGVRQTEADRAAGREPHRDGTTTEETCAVLALGAVSGLFGDPRPPRPWLLEGMGPARWAGELAVGHLAKTARDMQMSWSATV